MDFVTVKSKVGLLNKEVKIIYSVHFPLTVSVPSFGYLRCFKSIFDAVKSKVGLLNE